MKLLIVAAGFGTRLRRGAKHLVSLWGRPLIYYPLVTAGYFVDEEPLVVVQSVYLEETRARLRENGLNAELVASFCPHCENGYSLLLGLRRVDGPVLLSVADHIYEPCLVKKLLDHCPQDAGVCVAGDRSPRLVDIEEATKIRVRGSSVAFSKKISDFDYVDTGVFIVRDTRGIIERFGERTDLTMNMLWNEYSSQGGVISVVDVTGCRWGDIDTEADLLSFENGARRELLEEVILGLSCEGDRM